MQIEKRKEKKVKRPATFGAEEHLVLHFLQGGQLIRVVRDAVRLQEASARKLVEILAGVHRRIEPGQKARRSSDARWTGAQLSGSGNILAGRRGFLPAAGRIAQSRYPNPSCDKKKRN